MLHELHHISQLSLLAASRQWFFFAYLNCHWEKLILLFCFSDGNLDIDEFRILCQALFRNNKGQTYETPEDHLQDIFQIFDHNHDGQIDKEEFTYCWNNWIKTVSIFIMLNTKLILATPTPKDKMNATNKFLFSVTEKMFHISINQHTL